MGRLGAVRLGIDDHVGEEVVVAREAIVGAHGGGALPIIGLEQVEPHVEDDARRDMVRRAAHEAEMEFRPRL